MSTRRTWALWSPILKPFSASFLPGSAAETCVKLRPCRRAGFQTVRARRRPEVVNQRYGTANEPPPHLGGGKSASKAPQSPRPKPGQTEVNVEAQEEQQKPDGSDGKDQEHATDTVINLAAPAKSEKEKGGQQSRESNGSMTPQSETEQPIAKDNALGQILKMELPISESNEEKPPHLQAPPYVHHFDTYTLVRALQEDESFSQDQAVSIMKAVRGMMADNMDLAREGIVGKGDAEMAAYLFNAACSELRTEMRNNRSTLTERMRTERTGLQHEVDILSQRITADSSTLKDDLKGMFDDRKMSVRMERRDVENQIQELNYTITARLNSEMRSEVEGLRWVLVRRTAMAIVIVAASALILLRMSSSAQKRVEEQGKDRSSGKGGGQGGGSVDREFASLGAGGAVASSSDLLKGIEGGGDPALSPLG